ncbi:myosin light chain kinase 2, skeletal/cardiac muscle-like isoform X2 [Engraulis encrasicolus]|uniref:myosin light chain kinase 2, skeletal/cardiac muscle-like isoform X2 n=1 Tax=Engraulis encrasicolus TaxID=184585 RepID=UPI002FD28B8C
MEGLLTDRNVWIVGSVCLIASLVWRRLWWRFIAPKRKKEAQADTHTEFKAKSADEVLQVRSFKSQKKTTPEEVQKLNRENFQRSYDNQNEGEIPASDLQLQAQKEAEHKDLVYSEKKKEDDTETRELDAQREKQIDVERKEFPTEEKELSTYIEQRELSTELKERSTEEKKLSTELKDLSTERKELFTEQKELFTELKELSTEQKELSTEQKELFTEQKELFTEQRELSTEGRDKDDVQQLERREEADGTVQRPEAEAKDVGIARPDGDGEREQGSSALPDSSQSEAGMSSKRQLSEEDLLQEEQKKSRMEEEKEEEKSRVEKEKEHQEEAAMEEVTANREEMRERGAELAKEEVEKKEKEEEEEEAKTEEKGAGEAGSAVETEAAAPTSSSSSAAAAAAPPPSPPAAAAASAAPPPPAAPAPAASASASAARPLDVEGATGPAAGQEGEEAPAGEYIIESSPPPRAPFQHRIVTTKSQNIGAFYNIKNDEVLGGGRFGIVHKCVERESGLTLAAKIIKARTQKEKDFVKNEILVMNQLDHANLIQLYAAFENRYNITLVLEYVEGGELFDRIIDDSCNLTELDTVLFIRQISEGLQYMHRMYILHLDLKPENILCVSRETNKIKIIDFGLARRYKPREKLKVSFGTPEFLAPEVINYEFVSFPTDMWSLGVITYMLLSGLSPFLGDDDSETLNNILSSQPGFEEAEFAHTSEEAKDFITRLLVKSKSWRMSATKALKHPWLSDRGLHYRLYEKQKQLNPSKDTPLPLPPPSDT